MILNSLKEFVVELLFPVQCQSCARDSAYLLCNSCAKQLLASRCVRCQNLLQAGFCRRCASIMRVSGFRAMAPYTLVKQWITRNKLDLASKSQLMDSKLFEEFFDEIMVNLNQPLSIEFVPSQEGSNWTSKVLPLSVAKRIGPPSLHRIAGQAAQKYLNREERTSQKIRLFKESSSKVINTNTVLLIDDVMSTGASLDSCISKLLGLGYRKVYVLVFAYQKMLSEENYGP